VQDSFATPDIASRITHLRNILRLKSRIKSALRIGGHDMQMHCLPEPIVRSALGSATVADIQFTNTGLKDFNGKLIYLQHAPASGYVSKQYCVVKQP
jgi:hypothetical protein